MNSIKSQLIEKINEDQLYNQCLDYINLLENKIESLKYNDLPSIVNCDGNVDEYNLSEYFMIRPSGKDAGFARYVKVDSFIDTNTVNFYVYKAEEERFDVRHLLKNFKKIGINYKDKFVFFIHFQHTMPYHVYNVKEEHIPLMQKYMHFAAKNNKKFIIAILAAHEAPTYKYNCKEYCDAISHELNLPLSNFIFIGGAWHQHGEPVKNSLCLDVAINPISFPKTSAEYSPKYHFISLARTAKLHRLVATVEILDRGLKEFGNLSLGSGWYFDRSENSNIWNYVPERYKDIMPLTLDGFITGGNAEQQYVGVDERFTHAFVNFVLESSYERQLNSLQWNAPFVTEKSTKPFIWGQVPIFVGYYKHVENIRHLGFDVFDDLIDHSYDLELDANKRIIMAVDQLEKICKMPLEHWENYKQENMDRFVKNRNTASYMLKDFIPKINAANFQQVLDSYDI